MDRVLTPPDLSSSGERVKRVAAYEGLPLDAEGVEDPEAVAALVGALGEMLRRLGLRKLEVVGDGVVVAEG